MGPRAIDGHGGECVGKTEIDSASSKGVGVAGITHVTLWERVTKDSIWKIGSGEFGENLTDTADALKLKNHDKNLSNQIGNLRLFDEVAEKKNEAPGPLTREESLFFRAEFGTETTENNCF